MKNNLNNLLIAIFCLLIVACAEDKGNYDYSSINNVEIFGIPGDTSMQKLQTLVISPKFKRLLDKSEDGLEFSWTIKGEEVCTTRDLTYLIPGEANPGKVDCRYVVTDTKTGVKYYKTFNLSVVSLFSWGYYFFCEKQNKQSILSYWDIKEGTTEMVHTTKVGDYEFGSEPIQVVGSFGRISSLNDYFWTMSFISAKSENPVIITDNGAFMPTSLINNSNFVYDDLSFNPSGMVNMRTGAQYFLTNNQICRYDSGLLYRPGNKDKNYKWSHIASDYPTIFAFDELTKRYYILKNELNDPVNGLIQDAYALDRVVELKNQPDYTGKTIIGSFAIRPTADHILTAFTADNNGINLIEITYIDSKAATDTEPAIFEEGICTANISFPISGGISSNACALSSKNDWYIASGSTIYTSPKLLPTFTEWVKIPTELGEIVKITLSGASSKIIIATYNSNSSAEKKGSFVIIDVVTKEQKVYSNMIDKCVSIGGFNTGGFGWGEGDGQ